MEEMSTVATTSAEPKNVIVERVKDFNKASWNVHEVRPTKHGFDLYLGTPRDTYHSPYRGLSKLIVTRALRNYWHANRTKNSRFFLDLPVSSSGLKLALRNLRFYHREDLLAFWKKRVDDLAALPTREFAAKHGVDPAAAFDWRLKLVKRGRPKGWWRTPEFLKILLSSMSLTEAARELGIEFSEVHRLRRLAKRESK